MQIARKNDRDTAIFQIVQVTKSDCFKYRAQVPGYPSTEIGTGKTRKTSLSDPRKCDEELSPIPSIWSRKKVHPIHESVMKNPRRFRLSGPMLNTSVRNTFAGRLLGQIQTASGFKLDVLPEGQC